MPSQHNVVALAEITAVEIASALNQLVRAGTLKRNRLATALAVFWSQIDSGHYLILPISTSIIRRAAELCSLHSLKGYDAVQLACALTFRDDIRSADISLAATGGIAIGDPIFVTEDLRLRDAANAEGFTIDSPISHP